MSKIFLRGFNSIVNKTFNNRAWSAIIPIKKQKNIEVQYLYYISEEQDSFPEKSVRNHYFSEKKRFLCEQFLILFVNKSVERQNEINARDNI